jgi:sortase B
MQKKAFAGAFIFAAVCFGILFAHNLRLHVVYARETETAQEITRKIQDGFIAWQQEYIPPVQAIQPIPTEYNIPDVTLEIDVDFYLVYDEISDNMFEETNDTASVEESPVPLVQFFRELTGNNEIVAFIDIPGTDIQYPVVQRDNEFYLNHDIFRVRSRYGAIFLDNRNASDFSNPNSVIYGHNMISGLKFSTLTRFHCPDFFNENRYIYIHTPNDVIIYEIFSVFHTDVSFYYIQVCFETGEFMTLVNDIMRRRWHTSNVRVGPTDRILTLSTCIGSQGGDGRLVVVARKKI